MVVFSCLPLPQFAYNRQIFSMSHRLFESELAGSRAQHTRTFLAWTDGIALRWSLLGEMERPFTAIETVICTTDTFCSIPTYLRR